MEHQKILNLLNEASYSRLLTRKSNIVNHQSNANYDVGNEVIYNTKVLKSDSCHYNDTCILVRGDITIVGDNGAEAAFKNSAPFIMCFKKNDGTTIDGAEDVDLVMLMYNLLQYSLNYSNTTGSLWIYSNNKATNFNADIVVFKFFCV